MRKPVSSRGHDGRIDRKPDSPSLAPKAECLSLIDIFRELPRDEVTPLAAELPMRTYSASAVISHAATRVTSCSCSSTA